MAKGFYISKALAIGTVILTVSAIAGTITMIIVYKAQLDKLDPTPRPTHASTTPFPTGPPPNMRLPGNLVPESYQIYIKTHFYTRIIEKVNVTTPKQMTNFTGNSTVNFECVNSTMTIFIHSRGLTINTVWVINRDTNRKVPVNHTEHHKDESDFFEIHVKEVLKKGGNYSLFTDFEGEMRDDLAGLYLSTYKQGVQTEGDNTERFAAITQMQPTDARKVFPCFDEPAMKATFEVTITHREETTALGNARERDSNMEDGWKFTRFFPTPKMSTYLLSFVVSEFTYTPSNHERVKIKTYARPEAIEGGQADYAAGITGKILKFFEDRFAIDFPQDKLDQFAAPDFAAGAMENLGLVIYQESSLLFENGITSLLSKDWIATIIAHELAHQWFGNLVTMRWWNEVWLNEGFATYFSYLAVDAIEPSWNIKDMLVVSNLHAAFEWDALASSHPLSSPPDKVQTPAEITEMFDTIAYSKGSAILRMLSDMISDRVFTEGIKEYLKAFQHKNTEQADLWNSLQKAVDDNHGQMDVAKVMNTWTNQVGYPVVTINTTNGEVYQKRFLYNQTAESSLVWHIPIKVMSQTSGPSLVTLDHSNPVKKEEFLSKNGEWILANINSTGYYRVNYNPENWDRLLTQLEMNPELIPIINRGQLIDDAFNLARAELVNVTLSLNSTRFLRNETEFIPWDSAVNNLRYMMLMFDRSEVYGPMQAYLQQRVTKLYNFFKDYTDNSTVPSDHSQQHCQMIAVGVACTSGLPECRAMATRMFDIWMQNDTNIIHPNLRSLIYCQAIAAGGEAEWEFGWKKFQTTNITSERDQLSYALACTKKIWLLNRYLQYTLDPEKIRKMDAVSVINAIARNVAGQALAWNFVRAHWTYISQEYGAGMMPLGALIDGVTQRFSTDFELQELNRFKMEHNEEELGSASRAVDQAIELTQANIKWVKENKQAILKWFQRESAS